MEATRKILLQPFDFLPLKSNGNIHEGNALRMDWNDVLPAERCAYIVGNPPFYGARNQSKEQKAELVEVFHGAKNSGNVDYVAGWYMKAAEYAQGSHVRCAFVSMNSICQGEQLDKLPLCRERIEAVRAFRLASKSAPTRKLAEMPCRFHVENMPEGTSILVPKVSSVHVSVLAVRRLPVCLCPTVRVFS